MTTETETHLRELLAKALNALLDYDAGVVNFKDQPGRTYILALLDAAPALLDELEALKMQAKSLKGEADGWNEQSRRFRIGWTEAAKDADRLRKDNERLREALTAIQCRAIPMTAGDEYRRGYGDALQTTGELARAALNPPGEKP